MCDNGKADWGCLDGEPAETRTPPTERGRSDSLDVAFEVLADRRRRAVVAHFLEADAQTATVPELAERCRRYLGESPDALSVDREAIHLHHYHLPKLEDADVVEYDTRSETVRYHGDALVESLFGQVRTEEER